MPSSTTSTSTSISTSTSTSTYAYTYTSTYTSTSTRSPRGVNTNSQHDINGWTALHWAAKRNHLNIVNLLCNHGADKNIATNKGEVAAQLTSEGVIKV